MSGGRLPKPYIPYLIIGIALAVAALSFLLPVASTVQNAFQAHMRTAIAVVVAVLFIGAAVLFLRGVRVFKTGLRVAYIVLAISIIMLSLALLQLPVFGLYDLWHTAWVDSGGAIVPFGLATIMVYVAMRKFAKVLDLKTILRSGMFIAAITLVFTALLYVATQHFIQYDLTGDREGADLYIAIVGWAATFAFAAGLLAKKITTTIGEHYRTAMRWLTAGLLSVGLATYHESFSTFIVNNGFAYNDWGWYLWPFVVAGVILVFAGYKFRIASVLPDVMEAADKSLVAKDTDYIESITSVAKLASRPQEIDPILDDLRYVTSKPGVDKVLSLEDKKKLIGVYKQLEGYLTTSDPLRSLTKAEIRQQATPAFRSLV